ncbi:MAG: hypothetical protein EA377_08895 [Phycisphaerales bacterium]|nr:MAG: hypothetical protein EA377_08895 [Phycisphaerales bacterium]
MTRRAKLTIAVIFTVTLILGGIAIYQAMVWDQRQAFRAAWAAYLDAGGPASLDAIELPVVPDEENAGPHYRTAWKAIEQMENWWTLSSRISATLTGEDHDELLTDEEQRELLAQHETMLREVIEISRMTHCVWNAAMYDPQSGQIQFNIELPWHGPGGLVGNLLCLRAITLAEEGRFDEADESLAAALRLADHLAEPPLMITLLSRAGLQSHVFRVIERIHGRSGRASPKLAAALHEIDPRRGAKQALLIEGLMVQMPAQELRSMVTTMDHQNPPRSSMRNMTKQRTAYLERLLHNAEIIETSPAARVPQVIVEPDSIFDSNQRLMEYLSLPYTYFDQRLSRAEVERELTRNALTILDYLERNGTVPDDGLQPTDDPVTGKPLRYERLSDTEFTLSSDSEFRQQRLHWNGSRHDPD